MSFYCVSFIIYCAKFFANIFQYFLKTFLLFNSNFKKLKIFQKFDLQLFWLAYFNATFFTLF